MTTDHGARIEDAPTRDLAPQRRQRILDIVSAHRAARLEDLSQALGVSMATVRRDLDELASQGLLHRVHGGAVATERPPEPHFEIKAAEAAQEKERIAARAVSLLSPDETIYLDSGSTTLAMARLLRGWDSLTVVTNSLPIANEIGGHGPKLIMIGGEFRPTSQAFVGPLSRHLLENLHVGKAFIGTYALSLEDGLSTTDTSEAYTKALAMKRATEVIVLADSRKIGTTAFAGAGQLDQVDILVTDAGIEDHVARELQKRGIAVIKA
jgi:DeoR/GlpR family transcriptional regulator of sugar metabolism